MVGLLEAGVGHNQLAVIEHQMRDQRVTPIAHLPPELGGLPFQLRESGLKPIGDVHLGAVERADQLGFVIARHGERGTGCGHAHGQAQHPDAARTAIDEITDEDHRATFWVRGVHRTPLFVVFDGVAQFTQQVYQLRQAAVHVPDDVEGAVQVAFVVE